MCERGQTRRVGIDWTSLQAVVDVDICIAPLVQVLNDIGMRTAASCCGHGIRPGIISLYDGRELLIAPDFDTARKVEAAFPPLAT